MLRVVSLSPNITEILLELGVKPIATTKFCRLEGKKVGGWINVNVEELKKLNPDIIFSCIFKPKLEGLEKKLVHYNVRSLHDIYELITSLGKIFEKEEKAEELISFMKKNFEFIKKEAKKRERVKIYFEESPKHFAGGNWISEIASFCNATTYIESGKPSRKVSLEEIEKFDPNLIILHWCGVKPNIKYFLSTPFSRLVKFKEINGLRIPINLFVVEDYYLNTPCHLLVKGTYAVDKIINTYFLLKE